MKKLSTLIVAIILTAFLTACGSKQEQAAEVPEQAGQNEQTEAASEQSWRAAYLALLHEESWDAYGIEQEDRENMRFSMADMDGDEVPELVADLGAGVAAYLFAIDRSDNTVKLVSCFDASNGKWTSYCAGSNVIWTVVYVTTDGKEKTINYYYHLDGTTLVDDGNTLPDGLYKWNDITGSGLDTAEELLESLQGE